jgi:uncharacterized repeat protein (TIGR01451 family)
MRFLPRLALVASLCVSSLVAQAAYVNLTPTPIIVNGAMVFAGNTIGLNKNATTNAPGNSGAVGAFMKVNDNCTLDATSTDGTYPAGTTSNWRVGGSCAAVDIPAGAVVKKAQLIWSGSYNYNGENVSANLNDAVTLLRPNGTTATITPAADGTAQTLGGTGPFYYTRSADVTALVTAGGTFGVRGIPATQADAQASANTGGWTLAVIYELSSLPARAMSMFAGAELGGNAAATVSGFCTPNTPTQSGRLLVSAVEGDSGITGDEMRFAKDATTLATAAGVISGPNNSATNFFSSQINSSSGALDTRGTFGTSNQTPGTAQIGRQGYDITNVDVSSKLVAAQTSAVARGTTTGDQYMINALGIQVDVGSPSFPVTTKTVDKSSAQVGEILSYSTVMRNVGSALATNVVFKDAMPPGTSFVAGSLSYQKTGAIAGSLVSPAGADPTAASGVAIPDIAVGDEITVTFRVRVDSVPVSPATAQYDNRAEWDYKYQSCAGSPIIDGRILTNPASTKVPRLAITKAVSPTGPISVGDTLTYTITTTNDGTAPTVGATLQDTIPAGASYVAGSTQLNGASVADVAAAMPFTTARIVNSAGAAPGVVAVGASATVTFQVKAIAGAINVANTAVADMDGAGAAPSVSSNVSNTILPPNLTVSKTAVGSFVRGRNATFNVEITNAVGAGKTDGTTVTVTDSLAAGLEMSSAPSGAGWACTFTTTSFSCTRADVLSAGATYPVISVPVKVLQTATDPIANTASVSGGGDTSPASNTVSVAVTSSADLRVQKIANPLNPLPGQAVTFTVTLTNAGPSDATTVVVNDPVPVGMTSPIVTTSVGTYTAPNWNVGTLASGASATLTMVATYNTGAATNTATATSATPDPVPGNNSASVTVPSQLADLQLLKSVDVAAPNVGSNVTFTLTLLNSGPDNATNVAVTDLLPAGLVFQSATAAQGTYNNTTGLWTVGSVAALGSTTLSIVARVDAVSPVTNAAEVTAADQRDPNSVVGNGRTTENDYASVTLIPQSADLQISKTVDNPNPRIGTPVVYTIKVTNRGPSAASGVVVNEAQPAGLLFNSATVSQGNYSVPTWTVGTLANGASATLIINATYNGPGQITNTATVSSATPDPDPTSNTASQSVPAQVADLSLNKSVDNASPAFGGEVVFTLTLANAGPSNATNVSVRDALPVGLTFVGATASQGAYNATGGDWNVGTVVAGDVLTLQIRARVDTTQPITNSAEITRSDQFDPDSTPGNNKAGEDDSASVTITPLAADLSIEKTASPNAATLNQPVVYTIVVRNAGPGPADAVRVTDLLPTGVVFTSANATQGAYDVGSGLWSVGTLANGASATLTINVVFTSTTPATITNYAQVDSATPDPNATNNTAKAPVKAKEVDLVVGKIVLTPASAQVPVGGLATFRVTVRNASAVDAATNVKLQDVLPAGVQFVSATASSGSYASGNGLWFIPIVNANTTETLDIVVKMTGLTPQINTAKLTGLDQYETGPGANEASATLTPIYLDLLMTKTVSPVAPGIGDPVAFTLGVHNNGPSDATGVVVSDKLPPGLAFVSANPPAQYDAITGVWTVGNIPASTTATLVINTTFTGPGPVLNTARVTAVDQPDTNLNNNESSASLPSQIADLALTKTADNTDPKPNDVVTFTITLKNNGPDAATSPSVNDAVPAGFTVLSTSPSQGTYTTPTWTVGPLANSASATLVIVARLTGTAPQVNTAIATNPSQQDPNTGNNQQSVTITPQRAELTIIKTVAATPVNVTGNAVFTVTVSNAGPSAATNVTVTDLLPAGLTFAGAAPSAGAYDPVAGVWRIDSIANGGNATLTITARVDGRGPYRNTATVTGVDQLDDPAGNTSFADVSGVRADLVVTKTATPPTPLPGQPVRFTITVNNAGEDAAANVNVFDPIPVGFTLITPTASQGSYNAATGFWSIGTLNASANVQLTMDGTFVGPAALTNTAGVTSDTYDPVTTNNSASVTLPSQVADIKVRKSVDQTNADFGSNVTFTVIVDNAGPEAATNVRVADALPAGLTYVSHNTATGTYVPGTGLWSVGNLSNGGSATLSVVATVSGTAPAQNKATAQADQFDPDTSSNTATADVVPRAANLRIAKNVSNAQPTNGEILTYTLVATNDGPSVATPVTVADALPTGLTLIDFVATQGNYAAGSWNVGTLAATKNATLTVRARYAATGSAVVNTATISSPVPDPDPSDNTRSIGVPAQIADLSLTKTVSNATPTLGGNVTYSITTRNAGPNGATGVVVRDKLPAGLLLVSATPSQGAYDAATGNWAVGTLANAGNATLTIVATVTGTQAIANVAEITKSDQFDPNSTPNNGDATENDQASATVTAQFADLRTSKTVDNPQPGNGEIVAFTVEVLNSGNAAAPNVIVNDALPAGLSFVAATPSIGTYSSATGVWTVGTLATNARATLTILATYTANGLKVTNTARATSDLPDPNPADNVSSVTVPAEIADLSINKTVAPPRPQVGGEVTFTIVLSNAGPDTAKQVKARDQLPAGLQYLSSTVTQGSYNAATGMWDVGTINNAANATLTIRAKVLSASAGQNIAEVTSSAQFDPNSVPNNSQAAENDQSIAQFAPQVSNLAVQKTANVLNPVPAQAFAYSIKVTNNGPDAATNVSVSEALPAGIAFTSANATQGAYDAATGLWPVGTLANGASATLTLNVIYNGPGVVVNTATATSDQFDPDLTDNTGRIAVPSQIADLKITKTVNDAVPNRGTNVTFIIEVENLGPDAATNAEITDALPAGLTLVSANATAGAYANATGKWTIPTLANTVKATLTIVATATGDAAVTNTARVTKLDQFDPATSNNVSQAVVTPQVANLSITKSVNNTKPAANELLTYTIIVRNAGPSTARAVRVNESLPAGLTYVSNTTSVGTFDAGTGVWTVGDLANAAQATLTLSARYTAPGTVVTNSVSVTSTTPDSDITNNAASQAVPSDGPDLTIVKRALPGAIQGGSVTYEFVVSNIGGAASIGEVTITDVLPAGLGVSLPLAPTINGWACLLAGQTLTCKRSDPLFGSGASYPTLSIKATIAQNVAIGALDNTAVVSGGGDVIATNNRSTATTQVAQFIEINVPTLSAWLILVLSITLVGFAARRIRRELH